MTQEFTVQNALSLMSKELLLRYNIFSLDKSERTKSHSFAIGSQTGKQFAIVLGKKDGDGDFSSRLRIITEKTSDPKIPDVRWSAEPYRGGKISTQKTTSLGYDNNLIKSNQSSFFIANETAFRDFINWYSTGTVPKPVLKEENQYPNITPLESTISDRDIQKNDLEITEDLINLASESGDSTTTTQSIQARLGQGKFRKNVIETWGLGECCALTGISITPLLIASHIIPWRESDDTQRLSGTNGILLCSHLDKLFDQHLISFDFEGNLITSSRLSDLDWDQLKAIGIHKSLRLNTEKLSPENAAEVANNLDEHRKKLENS
ncbi:hypothetical protein MTYM_01315 [Methylococcales bacterium]|nr:hypothetical protein MTYM_01315 [Methylococcales bacterium]